MSDLTKRLLPVCLAVIGGLSMFGCTSGKTEDTTADTAQTAAQTDTADTAAPAGEITAVHFCYDMFSGNQFKLDAWVEEISADGAKLTLEKRVGPMNYTGSSKDGELTLSREKTDELLEILSRYDIEGYSRLPRAGHSSAPSRTLAVFYGERMVDISFDAKFPETIPPVEDVMYYELYAFFNDIVSAEPGWEEVRSDNLPDPRDNPGYGERTVIHMGCEVRLVPGTGTDYEDGRGAQIDYGGEKWWLVEGFTGTWEITDADTDWPDRTNETVTLTVTEDGAATLTVDGETWEAQLYDDRCYRSDIGIRFAQGYDYRTVTVEMQEEDSYGRLRLYCYPGPIPEPQFDPIDVLVSKTR